MTGLSKFLTLVFAVLASVSAHALSAEDFSEQERQVVMKDGFDYIIEHHERRGAPSAEFKKILQKARRVDPSLKSESDIKVAYRLVNELS